MLGAIYIGLSGMNAFSKGLTTISNNVTNMNSLGFKSTSVRFTDVFSQGGLGSSYGGSNSASRGLGVRYATPLLDFGQGENRNTGNGLDLSIQGQGFLAVSDGDRLYYARTGQFTPTDDGQIALLGTRYRLNVMGANGRPQRADFSQHRISPPEATTRISFSQNLSSTATEAVISEIAVYDSLGERHSWRLTLEPVGAASPNEWTATVRDESGTEIGQSTLRFIGGIMDPSTARFTVNAAPNGVDPLSVEMDFSSGVTSFSSGTTSTLGVDDSDGRAMGRLTTIQVTDEGRLELTYSNGETLDLGEIAIAEFSDLQGLRQLGDGIFDAGGSNVRFSSDSSSVLSGMLEASNVNLSEQFGDLILIQRGFQASSQVVSVSNDMIQQLFGIRGQG